MCSFFFSHSLVSLVTVSDTVRGSGMTGERGHSEEWPWLRERWPPTELLLWCGASAQVPGESAQVHCEPLGSGR